MQKSRSPVTERFGDLWVGVGEGPGGCWVGEYLTVEL